MNTNLGCKLYYNQGKPYLVFSIGNTVYTRRAYNIDRRDCTAVIIFKKKSYRVSFYK